MALEHIQYTLFFDHNFANFLNEQATLHTSSHLSTRGLTDDGENISTIRRRTAEQKCAHLNLLLYQIANFCPAISRKTIVKNLTAFPVIWQAILVTFWVSADRRTLLELCKHQTRATRTPRRSFPASHVFYERQFVGG